MRVTPAARHPQVQAPGRARAIHVQLDEGGGIAGLAGLAPERVAGLWTFRDWKKNSFPFVQLKSSLLDAVDAAHLKKALEGSHDAELRQILRRAVRETIKWPNPFDKRLIVRCEERRAAVDGIDATSSCVPAVLERGVAAMRDPAFGRKLCEALLDAEAEGLLGNDGLKIVVAALTGEIKAGKVSGPNLYFDVDRMFRQNGRVQSVIDAAHVRDHEANIAAALARNTPGVSIAVCALTGERAELHEGSFPTPDLPPPFKGVAIYTRNVAHTPAARHYGEKATFAVRVDLPPLLAGTIEELTKDRRKGRSWRLVPGEQAMQNDLLVAAVELDAETPLADALATSPDDIDAEAAEDAEINIEHVVRTFEAATLNLKPGEKEPKATLLLLRRLGDSSNVKAIVSRRLSVPALSAAAQRWAEMQRNAPDLRLPVARGKAPQRPHRIAPLQLPAVTRASFLRGGSKRAEKPAPGLPPRNAYRLGQLFAAADAVHAGYCADMRGGALPPTLLGNEILGVALRGPIQGLDLLAQRLRPYQAWGVHFAVGEKVANGPRPVLKDGKEWSPGPGGGQRMSPEKRLELVRNSVWGLRDLARLCRAIDRERLGETPNDLARAEMILGYLAGSYEPESRKATQGGDDP